MNRDHRLQSRRLSLFLEESQQIQKHAALLQVRLLLVEQHIGQGELNVTRINKEVEEMAEQLAQIKKHLARMRRYT